MRELLGVNPQVLALALARMSESVGNSFLIVVLPLFIATDFITGATFGLTEVFITGFILSIFGFVNSPLQPFTGRLSDSTGRRKVFVLFGLVLIAAASFAYSLATTYWHLVGLRVLQGIAGAFIIPTTVALVNDLATEDNRGGNMGTYNTFRLVGFGVGPVAAGGVVAAGPYSIPFGASTVTITGFDAAFYFAASTATLAFLLVLTLIRDPEIEPSEDEGSVYSAFVVFDKRGENLLDPVFALGAVSFFLAVGIAVFATLGDIVNTRLDQGPEMFGLQFAAFVLAQILLQAPIGRATDFYGRKAFIVAGTIMLVPTTLIQGLIPDLTLFSGLISDPWLMFLARFLQGVAGAMVFAPALALAGDLATKGNSGTTLSVLTMAFGFGVAFGPLLSGFLVAWGFVVPFAFAAGLAAIGVAIVLTQIDEVIVPKRAIPLLGKVT
ncbi:MFS transporter [Halorubrum vacuolatum]|uniref:Predicted arabinose efflux permease, MFS family n=1 Tax=Halorubrum vacuolatum TaxID=63740 RepID=A0A238VD88_HALVU|nr:MFS transporter [Halorubrum vacuolatum]SNR32124.1 Predicted arabinose efflux permease, MFS family [Halorubrum vacuolatum]